MMPYNVETGQTKYKQFQLAMFIGKSMGQRCNFPIRIVALHPSCPDTYHIEAEHGHNCSFCPGWAHARELAQIGFDDPR